MSYRPQFNIKKRGYDRFAVDAYVSQLQQELDFSQAKLNVYRKQLEFLTLQLEVKQEQCLQLINELRVLQNSVDKMVSMDDISSYVNNSDLEVARQTADEIILEALMIAKEILDNLSETASHTKDYKYDLLDKLNSVLQSISDIEIIEPLKIDLDLK